MRLVTVSDVPVSRRTTPPRSTQIDDTTWGALGTAADELGISRSALLRDLAAWYVRRPGAKMPPRPTAWRPPADDTE